MRNDRAVLATIGLLLLSAAAYSATDSTPAETTPPPPPDTAPLTPTSPEGALAPSSSGNAESTYTTDLPAPAPQTETAAPQAEASPPEVTSPEVTTEPPAPTESPESLAPDSVALESSPSEDSSRSTIEGFNPRIPLFQQLRPNLGVEVSGAIKALGSKVAIPGMTTEKVRGISVQLEYQPRFIQSIGVIGIGPMINFYPVTPLGSVISNYAGIFSAGGQIRYQMRYFREQPLVPMAGYSAEYVRYRLKDGTAGGVVAQGPFVGGMLLLNMFEPSGASEFYANHGVMRSYLVAEMRMLTGANNGFTVSGNSLFFGVRFEM